MSQTPGNVPLPIDEGLDPGQRSLSEALRTSFTLLKYVMIVLVVLYLASGIRRVQPNEKAVVLRFGKIVEPIRQPGWVFAWPYPIDEVVKVQTAEVRALEVDTFWFAQKPEDRARPLDNLRGKGLLTPGIDGYMVMGDRALLHARFQANYQVRDVRSWVTNVADGQALVQALLEDSVIGAAARFAGVDARGGKRDEFLEEVQRRLQDRLDAFDTGIDLVPDSGLVATTEITPPIDVRPAFRAVTEAESTKRKLEQDAQKEATSILNEAAGAAHAELVDLIEQYEAAENAAERQAVATLRESIDGVLLTEATGEAARVIDEARAYRTRLEQGVKADLELFRQLLPELRKNPGIVLDRLWKDTLMEVLRKADAKYFLLPGAKIWVDIGPEPEWKQQIRKEQQEAKKKQRGSP